MLRNTGIMIIPTINMVIVPSSTVKGCRVALYAFLSAGDMAAQSSTITSLKDPICVAPLLILLVW